jgi:hypothetical protein
MNYIKRLEKENAELVQALEDVQYIIQDFAQHLALAKFNKPDDWIRTWEVQERLINMDSRIREETQKSGMKTSKKGD